MIKISAPIKTHWAEKHDLNFEELMGAGKYKENHRQDMIKWSEDIRRKDYGYFCQAAVEMFSGMYFYTVHLFSDRGDNEGNKIDGYTVQSLLRGTFHGICIYKIWR